MGSQLGGRSGAGPHAQQSFATAVSGELVQLLEEAIAQHQRSAASACALSASAAVAEAMRHLLHLDLPAEQVRQLEECT